MTEEQPPPQNQASETKEPTEEEKKHAADQLLNYVMTEIKKGVLKSDIATQLEQSGFERKDALKYINDVDSYIKQVEKIEKFEASHILPALVGGLGGAVLGGIVWGYLAVWTDKFYSIIAIIIGFLCGYGVVLFTGGKRGIPAQSIAVITSAFGILIGAYIIFYHSLKKEMAEPALNMFSEYVITVFVKNVQTMFVPFEIVFLLISVFIAGIIPQKTFKK